MEGIHLNLESEILLADKSRLNRSDAKLLVTKNNSFIHRRLRDLPSLLPNNSVLVVNNSGTLPASLMGKTELGEPIEIRFIQNLSEQLNNPYRWKVLIFGSGSWKERTEVRQLPPPVQPGDLLRFDDLEAYINNVYLNGRILDITFIGSKMSVWSSIYRLGKPIQYSHLTEELHVWDVQTIFSSVPVSMEPPSASFQFSWKLVQELQLQGIEILPITHATSISSTGDRKIDGTLPFPERYIISKSSANRLNHAISRGKPIVALGTSVVRALESNFVQFQKINSGKFKTTLKINPAFERQVVDHLITGMHMPSESHIQLLRAFINKVELEVAYQSAIDNNYLWHEYGDLHLLLTHS